MGAEKMGDGLSKKVEIEAVGVVVGIESFEWIERPVEMDVVVVFF